MILRRLYNSVFLPELADAYDDFELGGRRAKRDNLKQPREA